MTLSDLYPGPFTTQDLPTCTSINQTCLDKTFAANKFVLLD